MRELWKIDWSPDEGGSGGCELPVDVDERIGWYVALTRLRTIPLISVLPSDNPLSPV